MPPSQQHTATLRSVLLVNEDDTALIAFSITNEFEQEVRVFRKERNSHASRLIKMSRRYRDPVHVDGELLQRMYSTCVVGSEVPKEFCEIILKIINEKDVLREREYGARPLK